MNRMVMLDTGPLGMISHPRPATDLVLWFAEVTAAGDEIVIPEIADYEVRRELLRAGKQKGVERLDELKASLTYVPITTDAMLEAAKFWADARRRGRSDRQG